MESSSCLSNMCHVKIRVAVYHRAELWGDYSWWRAAVLTDRLKPELLMTADTWRIDLILLCLRSKHSSQVCSINCPSALSGWIRVTDISNCLSHLRETAFLLPLSSQDIRGIHSCLIPSNYLEQQLPFKPLIRSLLIVLEQLTAGCCVETLQRTPPGL